MSARVVQWDVVGIRSLLGVVLVVAGALKAAHIDSPLLVGSIAWDFVRGSRELLLLIAVIEAFLGLCLLLNLWVRVITLACVIAFVGLAVVISVDYSSRGERACGCMGELGSMGLMAVARNAILASAALYVYWQLRRSSDRGGSAGLGLRA